MMGMLTRSKSIASLGLLVKNNDQADVYESFLAYNKEICKNIKTWFQSYFEEYDLKSFFRKNSLKNRRITVYLFC